MIDFWQAFAIFSLAVIATGFSIYLTWQIKRDRLIILSKMRSESEDFSAALSPEREYLENQIRELYERYAHTNEQLENLNEMARLSLKSNKALPSPENSFERSLEIAKKSAFVQGLGVNTDEIIQNFGTAFVLTPFSKSEEMAFRYIREACGSMGMSAFRASEKYSRSPILNSIVASIISSDFIIANITGRNPNVFYEMAIAQMLEKRVVMISDGRSPAAFDVNHQTILIYDNPRELLNLLPQTIARFMINSNVAGSVMEQ